MGIFYIEELNKNGQKKPRKWVSFLFFLIIFSSFFLMIGGSLYNFYSRSHPVDKECTLVSAEVFNSRSGTGGISTSSTELKINTDGCGTVYVDYVIAPKKSYQDMADELNQYQGEVVTLIFPPFQLPAEGDYVLGYGYRF
ncbi:hypothetical protein ACN08Y_06780 [Rothia sp. P5764]|uniref:hypothetical protein n=1 Tax=Rothia sp. P5764 TaxID=3402654 RepID=UPI003AC7DA34